MNEFNDFAIPPGYGEAGVPAFDQISHMTEPPYNAQPPHAVQVDYAAPAFDQTSHFVQSPFNAQPPHAVGMEYAAPSIAQTSHYVRPPFDAQPPHASVAMNYGADEAPKKVTGKKIYDVLSDVVDAFKPSGQDTPAGGTGSQGQGGEIAPKKEFPWGTVTLVGGSALALGIGAYFLLRKKD